MEEEKKFLENKVTDDIVEETEHEKISEEKMEKSEIIKDKNVEKEQIAIEEKDTKKEEEKIEEDTVEKKSINKKAIIITIVSIIILIFLSTIFAILNINNEKIIKGIYIEGVDVSNLTAEEAEERLNEKIVEIMPRDITLQYQEYTTTLTPEQIECEFKIDEAVQNAIKEGKTENILLDNYSILKANIFKTNFNIEINYNHEILNNLLENVAQELPGAVKKVSYEIDNEKLIISRGKEGVTIQTEELERSIIKNIEKQFKGVIDSENIPAIKQPEEEINIESIYNEIYKEPKDAYIEEDPITLHIEEEGLDFAITMEEAKNIIAEEKENYEIPLKITKPKVKTSDLGEKIFKQKLSQYTTIYDAGNTSRATNIAIAARTINGKIILPGETFSYNKVLGNTTKEKGYQLGTAYVGGKVVPAYGGGICQVSTTLYNAVLYANLGIVERYNHSYTVSYVPAGRDATVSYGGKDFKFKNTRKYPVKIVASAKNGVVKISLMGLEEEKEYEIELTSTVLSTTPYSTTYQTNSSLAEGKERVIQNGHNGFKSKAYKIVKYNGKVISRDLLSADTYQPMNKIIEKGTKQVKKEQSSETTQKEENKIEEAPITENED